jgi:hypothetical protein
MSTSLKECIVVLLQEQPKNQFTIQSLRKIVSKFSNLQGNRETPKEILDDAVNSLANDNVIVIDRNVIKLVDLLAAKNKKDKTMKLAGWTPEEVNLVPILINLTFSSFFFFFDFIL